jgi:transcriptional regulator with XRE-family HTH domain
MTETSPAVRVGKNVRAELARAGKTQTWLASVLALTQQSISSRLRGDVAFDVDELHRVADALAVPVASLLEQPASATRPATT